MSLIIYTTGDVYLDGRSTGFKVRQRPGITELYLPEILPDTDPAHPNGRALQCVPLPHCWYSLAFDNPMLCYETPGRTQFEADVRALVQSQEYRHGKFTWCAKCHTHPAVCDLCLMGDPKQPPDHFSGIVASGDHSPGTVILK